MTNACSYLANHIGKDDSPSPELLAHVRTCETCRSLVAEAARLESLLEEATPSPVDAGEPLVAETVERGEMVVAQSRARRAAIRLAGALVATSALALLVFWSIIGGFHLGRAPFIVSRSEYLQKGLPFIFGLTVLLGLLAGVTVGRFFASRKSVARPLLVPSVFLLLLSGEYAVAAYFARWSPDSFGLAVVLAALTAATLGGFAGRAGLPYKRLSPGRQISGVCRGLAEHGRLPLWAVRLVFLLLLAMKGIGLAIYLLLDLLMEVHPDDRSSLLRFRIRRWFASRRMV